MTRLHDQASKRSNESVETEEQHQISPMPPLPLPPRRSQTANRLLIIGMALGYLGLVVILAMAPTWQQMISPFQPSWPACAEYGGSR